MLCPHCGHKFDDVVEFNKHLEEVFTALLPDGLEFKFTDLNRFPDLSLDGDYEGDEDGNSAERTE